MYPRNHLLGYGVRNPSNLTVTVPVPKNRIMNSKPVRFSFTQRFVITAIAAICIAAFLPNTNSKAPIQAETQLSETRPLRNEIKKEQIKHSPLRSVPLTFVLKTK